MTTTIDTPATSMYPAPERVTEVIREWLADSYHPLGNLSTAMTFLWSVEPTEPQIEDLVTAVQTIDGITAGEITADQLLDAGEQLHVTPAVFLAHQVDAMHDLIRTTTAQLHGATVDGKPVRNW